MDGVKANAGSIATAATALGAPAMKIDTAAVQLASAAELGRRAREVRHAERGDRHLHDRPPPQAAGGRRGGRLPDGARSRGCRPDARSTTRTTGKSMRPAAASGEHSLHQAHARQRPRRAAARRPRLPDRRGEHLVSRRLEERAARPDRVRAPVRAPDVRRVAAPRPATSSRCRAPARSLNGSTNADRTNYWEVVPTGALELALWMESDRMGYLLPALTEAKFTNQRDVVLNERRQNYENRPYGLAPMAMLAALFPPDHPYHWTTIGESPICRRPSSTRCARSSGATITRRTPRSRSPATSTRRQALALATRYFGDDPAGRAASTPVRARRRSPARRAHAARGSRRAAAAVSGVAHARDVCGRRRRARSRRRSAGQRQDVAPVPPRWSSTSAWPPMSSASQNSREMAGFFQITATAAPGHTLAELERGRSSRRSRGSPATARPTRRSSAAACRPRRSSSSGCRRSAGSAASRTS